MVMHTTLVLGTRPEHRTKQWLQPWLRLLAMCVLLGLAAGAASAAVRPIDLASVLKEGGARSNAVLNWTQLPLGTKEFGGVPFKIDGLVAVTGMDDVRRGELFPSRVALASVQGKAERIHLLHGVAGGEKDGVPYAKLIFHFENGEQRAVRLAHGVQARDAMKGRRPAPEEVLDPRSRLAWSSGGDDAERRRGGVRLYQTSIRNPLPGQAIARVELVSLFSQGTPFIAAVTLDDSEGGDAFASGDGTLRRVMKKSLELPDRVYQDELVVRIADKVTGQPSTTARAALTIRDDEGSLYFGEAAADGSGVARLPFPPQQTLSFSILVRAPGRLPVVVEGAKRTGGDFPREWTATLDRGARIGGAVNDASGQPIADAAVLIHRVTSVGPREFERLDYETVRTGRDGKWASESVPAGATNLVFEVSHPEFRGGSFVLGLPPDPEVRALAAADVWAGTAKMTLENALRLAGTVVSDSGAAVRDAEIHLVDSNRGESRRVGASDAAGKFSVIVPEPGQVSLMVQAAGYRARLQVFNVPANARDARVTLTKSSPLAGRVMDQNNSPVAGARVRLDSWNGSKLLQWQAVTDQQGRFTWDSPPEGNLMFQVSAPNYFTSRMSIGSPANETQIILRQMSRVVGRVVDAETGKAIDDFMIVRGRAYNEGEPMRWERYDTTRGRRGEYSVRLTDYGSNVRLQLLIEAQGYMPAVSAELKSAGVFTNNFALKKARGISGVVQLPDGSPATNATLVLVEPGDEAYMEKPGELRRSGSGGDFQRTSPRGEFQFAPKLNPHTIIASHAQGFAEVRASNVIAGGEIVLQPWGRVQGRVRVGAGSQEDRTVIMTSADWEYGFEGRSGVPLSLSLRTEAGADGSFTFDRVPPGERKVALQVRVNDRSSGRGQGTTHAMPVLVSPGGTTEVMVGGTGRTVIGRMTVAGGDPEDVDWKRDIHTMYTILPPPPSLPGVVVTPNMTEPERQRAFREHNEKQRAYWMTEEGRALRRKHRQYVLLFETNGTFRVDNVEPGEYQVYVSLTNPDRPDNYYEYIGSMNKQVTVPAAKSGQENTPFDLGATSVQVRGIQRTGRRAPAFEVKTFEGKTIRLEDMKGKFVLLDFWATWAGTRNLDVQMLKAVHDAYGADDRLVLLGMNFDAEASLGAGAAKESGFKWPQAFVGPWGQGTIYQGYGLQGLPDNVLIDPDGKIAARNLRGSNIRNTIRTKLGAPRSPAPAPPK